MGAGGASTGGGGGGVGPAGLVTKTGKTGTKKDAKKVSRRNEFRTFVKEGGVIGKVVRGITGKTPYETNLERRQKFVKSKGLTSEEINLDPSYPGSKEGLKELKAQGYTTASDVSNNRNDNDNNNQPVIVQKNVGGQTVQTTEAKVEEDKKEATQYDERVTKKKGRSKNILTSKQGVMKTSADYSLGKKSLLGQVV